MFKYSPDHVEFITTAYKTKSSGVIAVEFTERFGVQRTAVQISSMLSTRGIKCGRKVGLPKGSRKLLNDEQHEYVVKAYREYSVNELTKHINDKFNTEFKSSQIEAYVHNHKIKSGRTGQFPKGNLSWNEGTKGVMKPNSGSFSKRTEPHNKRPIGSERINREGHVEIKVFDRGPWRTKQRVLWELRHGPVPEGHNIRFIDGDYLNFDEDNLILVSNSENLALNQLQYSKQPEALKESTLLIARIIARTRGIGRQKKS